MTEQKEQDSPDSFQFKTRYIAIEQRKIEEAINTDNYELGFELLSRLAPTKGPAQIQRAAVLLEGYRAIADRLNKRLGLYKDRAIRYEDNRTGLDLLKQTGISEKEIKDLSEYVRLGTPDEIRQKILGLEETVQQFDRTLAVFDR